VLDVAITFHAHVNIILLRLYLYFFSFPSVLDHNCACVSKFFRTYSIASYFHLLFKYYNNI